MIDANDYDAAADDLAEFGLTEDQIELVWAWHLDTCSAQTQTAGGVVIMRLMSYLLDGHCDASLRVRLAAVAYGTGLRKLMQDRSIEQTAESLGISRQALESAAKQAARSIMGD